MDTTFAFRAEGPHRDQPLPACLVWTLDDATRNRILDAVNTMRERGYAEVRLVTHLDAPMTCGKGLSEALADGVEFRVASPTDFNSTRDYLKVRGHRIEGNRTLTTPRVEPQRSVSLDHRRAARGVAIAPSEVGGCGYRDGISFPETGSR